MSLDILRWCHPYTRQQHMQAQGLMNELLQLRSTTVRLTITCHSQRSV